MSNHYDHIAVQKKTKDRLSSLMTKNQKYDEFVNILLDLYEKRKK